jgi:hypothetical protein
MINMIKTISNFIFHPPLMRRGGDRLLNGGQQHRLRHELIQDREVWRDIGMVLVLDIDRPQGRRQTINVARADICHQSCFADTVLAHDSVSLPSDKAQICVVQEDLSSKSQTELEVAKAVFLVIVHVFVMIWIALQDQEAQIVRKHMRWIEINSSVSSRFILAR